MPPILLFISISSSSSSELFLFILFLISSSIWGIVSGSSEGGRLDRLEEAGYEVCLEGTFIGISGVINLSCRINKIEEDKAIRISPNLIYLEIIEGGRYNVKN